MVVSKEYHSAEVENSLPASKIQPSILNVFCNASLRQAMLSCPLLWYCASAGTQGQCRPERSCQDGDLAQMNHFGLKQKLQSHSDPLKGKWEKCSFVSSGLQNPSGGGSFRTMQWHTAREEH